MLFALCTLICVARPALRYAGCVARAELRELRCPPIHFATDHDTIPSLHPPLLSPALTAFSAPLPQRPLPALPTPAILAASSLPPAAQPLRASPRRTHTRTHSSRSSLLQVSPCTASTLAIYSSHFSLLFLAPAAGAGFRRPGRRFRPGATATHTLPRPSASLRAWRCVTARAHAALPPLSASPRAAPVAPRTRACHLAHYYQPLLPRWATKSPPSPAGEGWE